MSERPTVRFATPEDLRGITETFKLSFDRFPPWPNEGGALTFVEWMTLGEGVVCRPAVSDLDGKIVGASTAQLRPALIRGRELTFLNGPFAAMHPLARGRGFYGELRYFDRHLSDIGLGFSQVPAIHRFRADGTENYARFANRWTVYARILHPLDEARRHRWHLATLPGYALLGIRGRIALRGAPPTGATVVSIERCDERFDAL